MGDPVTAGSGQLETDLAAGRVEEIMGNLNQNAGAVAGAGVGAHRAPMGEIEQHLEALLDNAVARLAIEIGDEAHATGIVLQCRIIKSLLSRHPGVVAPDWRSTVTRSQTQIILDYLVAQTV